MAGGGWGWLVVVRGGWWWLVVVFVIGIKVFSFILSFPHNAHPPPPTHNIHYPSKSSTPRPPCQQPLGRKTPASDDYK